MGLAERKAIKEFQDNHLPPLQQRIDAAAGVALPLEVDWDSLAVEGKTNLYTECWTKVYFEPLIKALKDIGADDMGRDALKNGLKKVKIGSHAQTAMASNWAKFVGGELTLDHKPLTNIGEIDQRAKALQKVLESGL